MSCLDEFRCPLWSALPSCTYVNILYTKRENTILKIGPDSGRFICHCDEAQLPKAAASAGILQSSSRTENNRYAHIHGRRTVRKSGTHETCWRNRDVDKDRDHGCE